MIFYCFKWSYTALLVHRISNKLTGPLSSFITFAVCPIGIIWLFGLPFVGDAFSISGFLFLFSDSIPFLGKITDILDFWKIKKFGFPRFAGGNVYFFGPVVSGIDKIPLLEKENRHFLLWQRKKNTQLIKWILID